MIHINAEDVWDKFIEKRDFLDVGMIVLADRDDFGVEIDLTRYGQNPYIVVNIDGDTIDSEILTGRQDAADAASRFYDKYITGNVMSNIIEALEPGENDEQSTMIEDREAEMDDAVYDLLHVFYPTFNKEQKDVERMYDRMKDLICETLFKEFGISVYRPMVLEDENGEDCFEHYPYPQMDLGD